MRFRSIVPPKFSRGAHTHGDIWILSVVMVRNPGLTRATHSNRRHIMDLIVTGVGFGFFALMLGYIKLCEKL